MKAKGTKGVSYVSWLSPLFVVFVFQSPPPIRSSISGKPGVSLSNAQGRGLAG